MTPSTRKEIQDIPLLVDLTREERATTNNNNDTVILLSDSDDSDNDVTTIIPETPKSKTKFTPKVTPRPKPPKQPSESPPPSLKCPICIETFTNIKKVGNKIVVTRCGHIFCDFCLKRAISDNGRKCPKCRKNVPRGATGFIEIYDVC